jgi:hypothetical protein
MAPRTVGVCEMGEHEERGSGEYELTVGHAQMGSADDDVLYLFLPKQKIGAKLHIYLYIGSIVGGEVDLAAPVPLRVVPKSRVAHASKFMFWWLWLPALSACASTPPLSSERSTTLRRRPSRVCLVAHPVRSRRAQRSLHPP